MVVVYALIVTSGLITAAIANPITDDGFVYDLGKCFALVGIALLTMQFVLSARLQWVERPFGLDAVFRYHKMMAGLTAGVLLMHPVLLALGGGGFGLIYSLDAPWYIWFGRVALVLLLAEVVGSAFRARLRLEFERWRLLHNQATLIFGLGAIHARVIGGDFEVEAMKVLWVTMVAVAAGAWLHHKLLVPAVARARSYRVVEIERETPNVWTLKLKPPPGRARFDYRPGQFHFLHFRRGRGLPSEEHPFTISSSPTGEHLTSTIKESGDFTRTIGLTSVGDAVAIRGPFGRFSYTYYRDRRDIVMIAGGIGITPLMSMLRHMRDWPVEAEVLLLYGNRAEEDIVFWEELQEMTRRGCPRLKVAHILSQPGESWTGERGYADRAAIERLVGGHYSDKMYYICGPPPMMDKVIRDLKALGVADDHVEFERFSL